MSRYRGQQPRAGIIPQQAFDTVTGWNLNGSVGPDDERIQIFPVTVSLGQARCPARAAVMKSMSPNGARSPRQRSRISCASAYSASLRGNIAAS